MPSQPHLWLTLSLGQLVDSLTAAKVPEARSQPDHTFSGSLDVLYLSLTEAQVLCKLSSISQHSRISGVFCGIKAVVESKVPVLFGLHAGDARVVR